MPARAQVSACLVLNLHSHMVATGVKAADVYIDEVGPAPDSYR